MYVPAFGSRKWWKIPAAKKACSCEVISFNTISIWSEDNVPTIGNVDPLSDVVKKTKKRKKKKAKKDLKVQNTVVQNTVLQNTLNEHFRIRC